MNTRFWKEWNNMEPISSQTGLCYVAVILLHSFSTYRWTFCQLVYNQVSSFPFHYRRTQNTKTDSCEILTSHLKNTCDFSKNINFHTFCNTCVIFIHNTSSLLFLFNDNDSCFFLNDLLAICWLLLFTVDKSLKSSYPFDVSLNVTADDEATMV